MPSDRRHELADLSAKLSEDMTRLFGNVKPPLARELGNVVRIMNCYYSNLIEGHPTHPVDIMKALSGDFAVNAKKRNLQLEAKAHIAVQELIDRGEAPSPASTRRFLVWAHHEFCTRLPDDLLWVENPDTGERMRVVPGEFRKTFVRVGNHLAPEPEQLDALLGRFEAAYAPDAVAWINRSVAVAAAHHRFLWLHPFLDGNGRVARLMSHAMFREFGQGGELWSVARGLARSVDLYKERLSEADEPRRGDLDGRGTLTDEGLSAFCKFFLNVARDQVAFMHTLLAPDELWGRVSVWCREEMALNRLPPRSDLILGEVVRSGSMARGEAASITGYGERQARSVLSALLARGVLLSDTPKGEVRLGFAAEVVERWLPRLYPAALAEAAE